MSNFMSNDNAISLFTKIGNKFSKRPSTFTGTTAQWNALTSEQKAQYEIVNITDDYSGGNTVSASVVTYDNTTSGLVATNAQAAIDELKSMINNLEGRVSNIENN